MSAPEWGAQARPCDWQDEWRTVECETPTENASGWCDEHEQDALELYPHLSLPVR